MYDFDIFVVDFIVRPLSCLKGRSENSTIIFVTLLISCLPVQSCLGFIIAGFSKKRRMFLGLSVKSEKVAW